MTSALERRIACSARRALQAILWIAAAGSVTAYAGSAAATYKVSIENLQFSPATLTVHRGDTVVWTNKDLFLHTVTKDTKGFNSGDIKPNGTWRYRVTESGELHYHCSYHPTMKASLTSR